MKYSVSLNLSKNCSVDFMQELIDNGFRIYLVGKLTRRHTEIIDPTKPYETSETSYINCIANLEGKLPSPKIYSLLYKNRNAIEECKICTLLL